ncbi:hypothetical protein DFP73DRAFT_531594 [Morchella snyderi]|nr:hypothetical protein DFP73DRAFT_531594 [Morchella snyderi]
MWVRDFLAKDLKHRQEPRVRILTYGYNSGLLSNTSTAGIAEFAQGLLESVTNARRLSDQEERPIVFVAHSLGGIVVKKALVKASKGTNHQRKVLRATYALICVGVPNRGMRNDELRTMVKGQPNEALISDLGMKSETLQLLHNAFSKIFSNSRVISVYETQLSNTVQKGESGKWNRDGTLSLMVPSQSATKSVHTEASCDQLSRNVDHSALAKFSNRDEDYFNLRGRIFDCVDKSIPTVRARFEKDMQESSHLGSVSSKLYQLPFELVFARNSNFTGGEDLLFNIHERILDRGFKKVILSGIGGLGKTNIVLEYAYRYQQFFTSVLWVNGSSKETTLQSFRAIAVRLINHYARNSKDATPNYNLIALELDLNGLVDENGQLSLGNESAEPIVVSVKKWLNRQSNQGWLLILDNVDDLESFAIDSFIPLCDHGAVLITTRRRRPDWLNKQAATELTKRLGNLPLALVQAGAYISANQISLRTYLETFNKQFKSVFSDIPLGSNYTKHDKTVFTTWQTSFEAIKRISADASDILEVCSFFSNEDIGEFMLQHGMMIDAMTLRRSLEPLFSYSLAQLKEANDSFYIHPLVHLWGRERLKTVEKIENIKKAVQILRNAAEHPGEYAQTQWLHGHRMIAHLEAVRLDVENHKIIEMLDEKDYSFLSDLEGICGIYRGTRYFEKEAGMLMKVLQARNRLTPGMNSDTVEVMTDLAVSYCRCGRWEEAGRLGLQVLETQREVLGDQHSDTLNAMALLAATYRVTGRWEEAERLGLQVLETRREVLGDQHSDTLRGMASLAITHCLNGRLKEAEVLQLQVLETRREVLGDQHSDTLGAMTGLAAIYRVTGRLEEAEVLDLQVLETRRKLLGELHPDTLCAISNLGFSTWYLGRFADAENLLSLALEYQKVVLGDEHPDTLRTAGYLSRTSRSLEKHKQAADLRLEHGLANDNMEESTAEITATESSSGRSSMRDLLEKLDDEHSDDLAIAELLQTDDRANEDMERELRLASQRYMEGFTTVEGSYGLSSMRELSVCTLYHPLYLCD